MFLSSLTSKRYLQVIEPQLLFLFLRYNILTASKKTFRPYFQKNGPDMTILSDVVKLKNTKNVHFWYIQLTFCTKVAPYSLNLMMEALHDVIH